jgi:hypothetical protein
VIYCEKKGEYTDQEMTCIKKNCPYYNTEKDSCKYPEKKDK